MNKSDTTQSVNAVWIDWNNRVVSFRETENFEKMLFASHEDMILFAFEKGSSGYRIQ